VSEQAEDQGSAQVLEQVAQAALERYKQKLLQQQQKPE
jgi:hypothetical protein